MREAPARVRHLTDDEIVDRVFPSAEGAPVPLHLAACPECQAKVARLREGWLLDRGAVEGTVDAIASEAWESQAASVMVRVRNEASRPARPVFPFRLRWPDRLVRRPALALSSVAAALALVTVMTVVRPRVSTPPDAAVSPLPSSPLSSTSTASAAPAVSVAATSAPGSPAVSVRDASDDELIREIDRLVSDEGPLHDLLPQEGA
jgi:hypothetical protein